MRTEAWLLLGSFVSSLAACGGVATTTLGSGSGEASGSANSGVSGTVSSAVGGSVSIGAGGTGGATAPTDLGLPDCVRSLFAGNGKCGGMVCHTGIGSASPELSSPGVASRLVDQPALFRDIVDPSGCPTGVKLIDTKNRSASWMLVTMQGAQGSCGSQMPIIGMLTSAERACLADWINTVQPNGT